MLLCACGYHLCLFHKWEPGCEDVVEGDSLRLFGYFILIAEYGQLKAP